MRFEGASKALGEGAGPSGCGDALETLSRRQFTAVEDQNVMGDGLRSSRRTPSNDSAPSPTLKGLRCPYKVRNFTQHPAQAGSVEVGGKGASLLACLLAGLACLLGPDSLCLDALEDRDKDLRCFCRRLGISIGHCSGM